MLEWYRVEEPYEALMADCAEFLAAAATAAATKEFTFRGRSADPFAAPERLTVAAAFTRHAGIDLMATLRLQPWAQQARVEDGLVITPAPEGRGRNLVTFLVESGHVPDSVSVRQKDLEDIFLSLTEGDS